MNKRKLKKIWDKNHWVLSYIPCVFMAIVIIASVFLPETPLSSEAYFAMNIILVMLLIIVTTINSAKDLEKKQKESYIRQKREYHHRVKLLENQKEYFKLVNKMTNDVLTLYGIRVQDVKRDSNIEYLECFAKELKKICREVEDEKPDSFIAAACLAHSILWNPVIRLDEVIDMENLQEINEKIAMNCIIELISEPTTYIEQDSLWVKKKHKKVKIEIPDGITENNLQTKILKAIYSDETGDSKIAIVQLANMLQMVYLYCAN